MFHNEMPQNAKKQRQKRNARTAERLSNGDKPKENAKEECTVTAGPNRKLETKARCTQPYTQIFMTDHK